MLHVHCVVMRTNGVSFVDHKQTSFIHYYIIYSLTYPRAGSVVTRSCALFERIRGRPYCLQGRHGSLKFTKVRIRVRVVIRKYAELSSEVLSSCAAEWILRPQKCHPN